MGYFSGCLDVDNTGPIAYYIPMRPQSPRVLKIEADVEFLRSHFQYSENSPSGLSLAREHRSDFPIGTPVGSKAGGYWRVAVNGVGVMAHRVIYILHYGEIPIRHVIDHKDGDTANNRVGNLQLATPAQNQHMRNRMGRNSTSGFMGVSWHRGKNRWRALMERAGKNFNLGFFSDPREAAMEYNTAVTSWAQAHGESPRFLNQFDGLVPSQ